MRIIQLHNQNSNFEEELKNDPRKNCCLRLTKTVKKMFKKEDEEINDHPIDAFIDKYWIMNIPDTLDKIENQR